MEYQQNVVYHQQQQSMMPVSSMPLCLPDSSSSNEKAIMWSQSYESGYSTQAPSISSLDSYHQQSSELQMSTATASCSLPKPSEWNNQQQQSLYHQPTLTSSSAVSTGGVVNSSVSTTNSDEPLPPLPVASTDATANRMINWVNSQDNVEFARQYMPELLATLSDEDAYVVKEAAMLLCQISVQPAVCNILTQTNQAVQLLVNCLNTTSEIETACFVVCTLYHISRLKNTGVQAIIAASGYEPIIKMLRTSTALPYAANILHSVLICCSNEVAEQIRQYGTLENLIPLLQSQNDEKILSIIVDMIILLLVFNKGDKKAFLQYGGTNIILTLLNCNHQYRKLTLNLLRLLKILSACPQNKQAMVNQNAMQLLSTHLSIEVSSESRATDTMNAMMIETCLCTLRNLSDAAVRLNVSGLDELLTILVNLLATEKDSSVAIIAAGLLSNITCNNENNKRVVLRANGISVLLHVLQQNTNLLQNIHMQTSMQQPQNMHVKQQNIIQLIEPCVSVLRNLTKCNNQDMLLAQEQLRGMDGIGVIEQLMQMQPRNWPTIKPLLGLVRNLCLNQLNSQHLRRHEMIEKLMRILYEAYDTILKRMQACSLPVTSSCVEVDKINLFDICELSSAALLTLAKDSQNQIIMRDLECIMFFMQMFYSQNQQFQRHAIRILAELSTRKECAEVIEHYPNLHSYVQTNFCNQHGALKTIAELNDTSSSVILQHVTTLMQRLQDHQNQRSIYIQQQQLQTIQQQPQRYHQQQPLIPSSMSQMAQSSMIPPQQQFTDQQHYIQMQMSAPVNNSPSGMPPLNGIQPQQPQSNVMYYNCQQQQQQQFY